MSIIDNRIVQMVFDNQKFEQNVSTTQRSLEELDRSISTYSENSSKNFLDISDGLSRLDAVFLGFYTKVGGYLADLSVSALNFAKSLSIDQLTAGFSKYTAETLAVQTITSNTNNTLEHTYEILKDILEYTDKTSYHYDSMTNTIAKFANQGVPLEQAATAVKGIANWAAISGAGIEKADITMSALIKSMASGSMQLREWRTISQVANMGTSQFRDLVIQTGQELAKTNKEYAEWNKINAENFEDSKDGVFGNNRLLTSELLLEVLKKYGDETSDLGKKALAAASEAKTFGEALGAVKDAVSTGFGKDFRSIFGNYDEARKFWTWFQDALLEIFTLGLEFRNKVLSIWHDKSIGGYKDLVEGLANAWEHLKQVLKPIGNAFHEALGFNDEYEIAKKLADVINRFSKWAGFKFNFSKNTNELADAYQKYYRVIFGENTGGKKHIKDSYLDEYNIFLDEMAKKADRNSTIIDNIHNAFSNFFQTFSNGVDIVKQFISGFKGVFSGFGSVVSGISGFIGSVAQYSRALTDSIKKTEFFGRIAESIKKIVSSVLKPIFETIGKVFGFLSEKLSDASNDMSLTETILDKIASAFEWFADVLVGKAIGPAIDGISKAFKWLKETAEPLGGIFEKIKEGIGKLFGSNKDTEEAEEKVSALSKILEGLGKALDFLWGIIKTIGEKITGFLKELFGALTGGGGGLEALLAGGGIAAIGIAFKRLAEALDTGGQLYDLLWKWSQAQFLKGLKDFAIALLILGASLLVISMVNGDKLADSFAVLSLMLFEMVAIMDHFSKMTISSGQTRKLTIMGVALIEFSAAILILASALKKIASIDSNKLVGATIVIEVLIGSLAGVAVLLSKNVKKFSKGGLALIEFALAVDILASAVKKLGELSWEELAKGLLGTVALMASVAGAALLMKNAGLNAGTGVAIIGMAAGLKILVGVVRDLGAMDFGQLGQGLLGVSVALIGIGLAMNTFPSEGMVGIGIGLIAVAAALEIIVDVMKKIAAMSLEDLAKSIISLTVALGVLGIAMNIMTGTAAGSASMLIMSVALVVFAGAVKMLAKLPLADLAKGIGALVIGIAALGTVMALLSGLAPGMLLVATAFGILGVALAAMGVGLLAIEAAGAGAIGVLSLLATAIATVIPFIAEKIAEGFIRILGVLGESGAAIMKFVSTLIVSVCDAIIVSVPKIIEAITTVILALLNAIVILIPEFVKAGLKIILGILEGIAESMPDIIQAGIDIVTAFILGIGDMVVAIVQAGIDMVINVLNGIAEAIRDPYNKKRMADAGKNLLDAIFGGFIQKLKDSWQTIKEKGKEFIGKFKEGFDEKLEAIKTWVKELPGKIKQWILEKWDDIKEAGGNIVSGIKQGISEWWNNLGIVKWFKGKIGSLTNAAKDELDEHSPSKVFAEIGRYIDEGLIVGINQYYDKVVGATETLGDGAIDAMKDSIDAMSEMNLEDMADPVIRPVLDLSEIQNGRNSISDLLNDNYALGVSTAFSGADRRNNEGTYAPVINMTINGAQGQNVEELAAVIERRLNQELRSRERVWV